MLPIAVLPVAGLLLRLGQPDLLEHRRSSPRPATRSSHNLGLLFAIGVAVGLARENHGAAGLAGVVGFLVATKGAEVLISVPPDALGRSDGRSARDLAAAAYKAQRARQAQRAGRHPLGPDRRGALQPLQRHRSCRTIWPSSAAGASCRSSAASPGSCWRWPFGLGWPALERGMDALSQRGAARRAARPVRLRRAEPRC